jgi:hypothetical protein
MFLRLLIFDHPRIRLLLLHPVIALVMTCRSEPDAAGAVPRDPPPTEGVPEKLKEQSRDQVKDDGEGDGVIQEPPD